MSGRLTLGSSTGLSTNLSSDDDPVRSLISVASSSMVSSSGLPMLTGPAKSLRAMARIPATVSSTKQIDRVCEPSPVIVIGSPVSAWRMNVGMARPSYGRMRGP